MLTATEAQAARIYELWGRCLHDGDVEGVATKAQLTNFGDAVPNRRSLRVA